MEPAQAKPVKKRRRWPIVALLLVLSTVAWWYWPRGEARFVGVWKETTETPQSTLSLRSNGMGRIQGPGFKFAFRWKINGDVLTLGEPFSSGVSSTLTPVVEYVFSLLDTRWVDDGITFHVLAVAENELTVRRDLDQKVLVFRRNAE